VIEHVVAASGGTVRVFAHVGRASTHQTCSLARRALDAGVSAIVAVVPYYYALDEAAILEHYRAFLEAAEGAPAYAYNIPGHTGNDLLPPIVAKLAAEGMAGLTAPSTSRASPGKKATRMPSPMPPRRQGYRVSKATAKEVATENIMINCVTPAVIQTEILDQMSGKHDQYM
jgi:hypothetical protein